MLSTGEETPEPDRHHHYQQQQQRRVASSRSSPSVPPVGTSPATINDVGGDGDDRPNADGDVVVGREQPPHATTSGVACPPPRRSRLRAAASFSSLPSSSSSHHHRVLLLRREQHERSRLGRRRPVPVARRRDDHRGGVDDGSTPRSPSCMAVRRGGGGGGVSLVAVAGPTGIAISELGQSSSSCGGLRAWMVLDYCSSARSRHHRVGRRYGGGVSCMSFQPSTYAHDDGVGGGSSSSSSVLLAAARGSGILLYDCSGRALSPLLGRLDACRRSVSDVGGGGSVDDVGVVGVRRPPPPSRGASSTESTSTGAATGSRGHGNNNVGAADGNGNNNHDNDEDGVGGGGLGRVWNVSTGRRLDDLDVKDYRHDDYDYDEDVVTSMDWKGPSAPVLLATCGRSACVWDLRTSSLGGAGEGGWGGARPTSRFVVRPEDDRYDHDDDDDRALRRLRRGRALVHCAYSATAESDHEFATMSTCGVVRVWDDRRADRPSRSFLACAGGGAGVASVRASGGGGRTSRWVTWGTDDGRDRQDDDKDDGGGGGDDDDDDLVVKIWTVPSSVGRGGKYRATSRISAPGGVAARAHPSFPDHVVVFADDLGAVQPERRPATTGPSADGGGATIPEVGEGDAVVGGGGHGGAIARGPRKRRTTPDGTASRDGPPSPPPLTLDEMDGVEMEPEPDELPPPSSSRARVGGGWKAELWRVAGSGDSPPPSAVDDAAGEGKCEPGIRRSLGARMITAFRGGGIEEDALSFAPGGGDDVGDVMAVDLASFAPVDGNPGINSGNDELALCVLTEAGRFTVYGVPEASILGKEKSAAAETMVPNKQVRAENVELNSSRSVLSRVYRQGNDHRGSEWWNKHEEEDLFGGESNTARESPNETSSVGDESKLAAPQFDIDLSSGSALRGVRRMTEDITEEASAPSIIPDGDLVASMEEVVENNDVGISATEVTIDPAVASRVPCPPLCGVAFSGVGCLVTFNNGPVKRMWSYYQSNRSISTPTSPNFGQISFQPQHMKKGDDAICDEDDASNQTAGQQSQSERETLLPKTLLDLIEMNLRGQSLQWGDGENEQPDGNAPSDNGGGSSSSGESSSYEDGDLLALESDESSRSSAASDNSDGFYHVDASNDSTPGDSSSMFDAYFSSSRKPLLGAECESLNGAFAGLPSLSPSVLISRKHDDILLNGQSPHLANLLKLGDQWWLTKDFTIPHSTWQNGDKNSSEDEFWRKSPDPRPSSSPVMRSASFSPTPKLSKHSSMMGNLKKLFANQLPTAMTPPDQRLLHNRNRQNAAQIDPSKERSGHGINKLHLGVYMLENPQTSAVASEQLAISQKLCLHNARVCSGCGQKAKADTWRLLAQTIESIFTFEMDETDGWGGNGDALTTGIVEQILCYYESERDFQMLATIVCVLTFGRDRRCLSSGAGGSYRLLPKFDERRYDNYLHRYAALLYGWGLLTVRSEISKRLVYATPGAGTETITWLETDGGKPMILPNAGVALGVTFTPVCGSCLEPVTDDDICRKCGEYPFQCSICCNPVRGACTWCPKCGHGGHVHHIMQWFQQHSVCPTGCGCVCMMGNSPVHLETTYHQ